MDFILGDLAFFGKSAAVHYEIGLLLQRPSRQGKIWKFDSASNSFLETHFIAAERLLDLVNCIHNSFNKLPAANDEKSHPNQHKRPDPLRFGVPFARCPLHHHLLFFFQGTDQ